MVEGGGSGVKGMEEAALAAKASVPWPDLTMRARRRRGCMRWGGGCGHVGEAVSCDLVWRRSNGVRRGASTTSLDFDNRDRWAAGSRARPSTSARQSR
ncbi:hypothetical protein E2562_007337 [Oryza meyeriana var. granulata]|uniref:DUF834 domain-containing protein n=1 Tax=Oryza meyeriana var. granulata TaxID=110450 RepID=A0A6G1CZK7_9ORYZ|nr:hypothetical protein E2562_007337 [Oryza meyeriana var. granulata]